MLDPLIMQLNGQTGLRGYGLSIDVGYNWGSMESMLLLLLNLCVAS